MKIIIIIILTTQQKGMGKLHILVKIGISIIRKGGQEVDWNCGNIDC